MFPVVITVAYVTLYHNSMAQGIGFSLIMTLHSCRFFILPNPMKTSQRQPALGLSGHARGRPEEQRGFEGDLRRGRRQPAHTGDHQLRIRRDGGDPGAGAAGHRPPPNGGLRRLLVRMGRPR